MDCVEQLTVKDNNSVLTKCPFIVNVLGPCSSELNRVNGVRLLHVTQTFPRSPLTPHASPIEPALLLAHHRGTIFIIFCRIVITPPNLNATSGVTTSNQADMTSLDFIASYRYRYPAHSTTHSHIHHHRYTYVRTYSRPCPWYYYIFIFYFSFITLSQHTQRQLKQLKR